MGENLPVAGNVLEIGCSTGETSQLRWKQVHFGQWMGWDTGADMVQQVQVAPDMENLAPQPSQ